MATQGEIRTKANALRAQLRRAEWRQAKRGRELSLAYRLHAAAQKAITVAVKRYWAEGNKVFLYRGRLRELTGAGGE